MSKQKEKVRQSLARRAGAAALIVLGLGALAAIGLAILGKKRLSDMSDAELHQEMNKCIDLKVQDYERAAVIRDLIKQRTSQIP